MPKKFLALAAALSVLIMVGAGCSSSTSDQNINSSTPPSDQNSSDNTTPPVTTPPSVSSTPTPTSSSGIPGSSTTSTGIKRVINLKSKQFLFAPSTITVKKGDTVEIHFSTDDVPHGFDLPDFNINVTATPGVSKTITFLADKTGSFKFFCSVPCGPGHPDMVGTFIVQ